MKKFLLLDNLHMTYKQSIHLQYGRMPAVLHNDWVSRVTRLQDSSTDPDRLVSHCLITLVASPCSRMLQESRLLLKGWGT